MGPLDQVKPWQIAGCEGVHRFLSRVWRLFVDEETGELRPFGETTPEVRMALHHAIREATEGIEALRMNTPVAKMMELVNTCAGKLPAHADAEDFLRILGVYAPHLACELWARIGNDSVLSAEPWPAWDPAALVRATQTYAVQVLGKMRGTVEVPNGAGQDEVVAEALKLDPVHRQLEGKEIKRVVFVPGRMVNLIIG
jgi:leucyl-tRNA synthetase